MLNKSFYTIAITVALVASVGFFVTLKLAEPDPVARGKVLQAKLEETQAILNRLPDATPRQQCEAADDIPVFDKPNGTMTHCIMVGGK